MEYRKQTIVTISVVVVILLVLAVITWFVVLSNREPSAAESLLLGAANTTFVDPKGNEMSLEQFDNTVRIINSWATWSPYSVQELQDLQAIASEFQDQGVVVLAVNRDEPQVRIDAFLSTLPEPLPLINFVVDTEDGLYDSFSGYAMPETLIYDANGNLVHHQRGVSSLTELRTRVQQAIAASQE